MKLAFIIKYLEELAPPVFQEGYDNAGLITGDYSMEINSTLISLDVTEDVIDEAVAKGANLVIAHHPIIFKGLKRLTGNNYVERTIIKAIKNDIAIYAIHTNLDSVEEGVSAKMCNIIGLENSRVLSPRKNILQKLAFFVPVKNADNVKNAIFNAGAGQIGNYDACSFNAAGFGTFRANENASPHVGKIGEIHKEEELKVEVIMPAYKQQQVVEALLKVHPYEEVAFDIYALENSTNNVGHGMIGELPKAMTETDFLHFLKEKFKLRVLKHTPLLNKKIKKVALCGGSGSFLLKNAISAKADIFISGDFTYHQYFDAENKIIIADIGHYESEQFTKNLLFDYLTKKIPTFAAQISETNTNPINYI